MKLSALESLQTTASLLRIPEDIDTFLEDAHHLEPTAYARMLAQNKLILKDASSDDPEVFILAANKSGSLPSALGALAYSSITPNVTVFSGPKHDLAPDQTDPTEEICDILNVKHVGYKADAPFGLRNGYIEMARHIRQFSSPARIHFTDAETITQPDWLKSWAEYLDDQDPDDSIIATGQLRFVERASLPEKQHINTLRFIAGTAVLGLRLLQPKKPKTIYQPNMVLAPSDDQFEQIIESIHNGMLLSDYTLQKDFELRDFAFAAGAIERMNWDIRSAVFTDGYRFPTVRDVLGAGVEPDHRLNLHGQPGGLMYDGEKKR